MGSSTMLFHSFFCLFEKNVFCKKMTKTKSDNLAAVSRIQIRNFMDGTGSGYLIPDLNV
jgi:hypothetical protein